MFETLSLSDFSPVVGSSFQVRTEPDVSLQLELLEAVKLSDIPAGFSQRSESFSLLFRGPADMMLSQQMCPLSHADLGELSVFLVPVGRDADGIQYEAVFN
jgi:hypothetical protein